MRSIKDQVEDFGPNYKQVRFLGAGSYGAVYECKRLSNPNGKSVAIKKFGKVFSSTVEAKRTLRELRLLRHLKDCKYIVGLLDIIPPTNLENFKRLNIVFEYVDTDLQKLFMSNQFWNNRHIPYILYQFMLGLNYMHTAKICHRDLKPANILINAKCSVRICDFGLARSWAVNKEKKLKPVSAQMIGRGIPRDASIPKVRSKREPTAHMVTRWYRPPEVILLEQQWKYMCAIDMWSVGCIMAELLQMLESNCPYVKQRRALFPGNSSYPLSPNSSSNPEVQPDDQLKMIFRVIGTPTKNQIESYKTHEVKRYLMKFTKRDPIDLRKAFPASPLEHIDLLQKLIRFDRRDRWSVKQALAHKMFEGIRDKKREISCEPVVFEFEDVAITTGTIRSAIVDEVLLYNPALAEQYGLLRSASCKRLVRKPKPALALKGSGRLTDLDEGERKTRMQQQDSGPQPPTDPRIRLGGSDLYSSATAKQPGSSKSMDMDQREKKVDDDPPRELASPEPDEMPEMDADQPDGGRQRSNTGSSSRMSEKDSMSECESPAPNPRPKRQQLADNSMGQDESPQSQKSLHQDKRYDLERPAGGGQTPDNYV